MPLAPISPLSEHGSGEQYFPPPVQVYELALLLSSPLNSPIWEAITPTTPISRSATTPPITTFLFTFLFGLSGGVGEAGEGEGGKAGGGGTGGGGGGDTGETGGRDGSVAADGTGSAGGAGGTSTGPSGGRPLLTGTEGAVGAWGTVCGVRSGTGGGEAGKGLLWLFEVLLSIILVCPIQF
ncbi:hypothetical protein HY333_01455 [Candidatus Collierbacteria bacterium]|nr:hypothetical protein [Candidatus Collierbacteria bacterium]